MSRPAKAAAEAFDGLPGNIDAERLVLGSILMNELLYAPGMLVAGDFLSEIHQVIFRRISDLHDRHEHIDRVTVAYELQKYGELESVGGLSYLVSLDDGLPALPHLDSYLQILREQSARRRIVYGCRDLENRSGLACEDVRDILATGQELFAGIAADTKTYRSIADLPLVSECANATVKYIREPELPAGALVALTGDSSSGKSSLATAWARDSGVPLLILDRENPPSVVADRFNRLGITEGPQFKAWGGWLSEEAPLPDAPIVSNWVRICEPKPIVIVDSLSAFGVEDENDASQMRRFMHRCRRLADLGATPVVLHHDGKSDKAKDYRGSSDFKAAVDVAFHLSNFGDGGRLDRLLLRCYKSRFGFAGELTYRYAAGQFVRGATSEAHEVVHETLTSIIRVHPGITTTEFDKEVKGRGIVRETARKWLINGVLSGAIERRSGVRNTLRHYLVATASQEGR
jgi:DnaB-like helicase N terminal domain/AAA domain